MQLNAQDSSIYWFDFEENLVLRGDPDTGVIDTLSKIEPRLPAALDIAGEVLYRADAPVEHNAPWIFRKDDEKLFSLATDTEIVMIRADTQNGYLYWIEITPPSDTPNTIRRSRFDGSEIEDITAGADIFRFRIDTDNENLYWAERNNGIIRRSDPDGSQTETIVQESDFLRIGDIEIDAAGETIYWSVSAADNETEPGIYRADLDGQNMKLIIDDLPENLTLDNDQDQIYWTVFDSRTIKRADLTDGQPEVIVTEQNIRLSPNDMVFAHTQGKLYWSEGSDGEAGYRIMASEPDGSHPAEEIAGFGPPVSVTIDPENQQVYWTTGYLREVMRAEMNGSGIQALVREQVALSTPTKGTIALDRESVTLYWGYSDFPSHTFRRMKTDGNEIEGFTVQSYSSVLTNAFAFDPLEETIYAGLNTGSGHALIRTDANDPESGDVTTLMDDFETAVTGLALDLDSGYVYWANFSGGQLLRANTDGTEMEVVMDGLNGPLGVKLDVENGHMYWSEQNAGTISRANLNGTEVLNLFTGLTKPGTPFFAFENSGISVSIPPVEKPGEFSLFQNYPNPFNPVTVIGYQLPAQSDVRLEVYDMLGRRVALLVDGLVQAGTHEITFDASMLASGVYLYRLTAGEFVQTRQMVLVK